MTSWHGNNSFGLGSETRIGAVVIRRIFPVRVAVNVKELSMEWLSAMSIDVLIVSCSSETDPIRIWEGGALYKYQSSE